MPSFSILTDDERENLASYVIHLSIRGQVEYRTMFDQLDLLAKNKGAADQPKFVMNVRDDFKNPTLKDAMQDNLALFINQWVGAQKPEAAIPRTPYPDV